MHNFPYKFTYMISCNLLFEVDKYLLYFYIHIAKTILYPKKKKSYFVILLNNVVTHKHAREKKQIHFFFILWNPSYTESLKKIIAYRFKYSIRIDNEYYFIIGCIR